MAELTTPRRDGCLACCGPAVQQTCCEPSEKAACCATNAAGGTCGCAAGGVRLPVPRICVCELSGNDIAAARDR